MRIVRVTTAFPPPWGGLRPGPYMLSLAQAQAGHNVVVLTREAGDTSGFDSDQPFKVIRVKSCRESDFAIRAAWLTRNLAKRCRIDVLHGHGFSALGALLLRRFGFLGLPVVTTFHILRSSQLRPPFSLRDRWVLLQERLCQQYSDGICAVSDEIARQIRASVSRRPVITVYNGADTERFSPHRRNPCDKVRILFVGALNGRKGESDLLQACARLLDDLKGSFALRILGEGPTKLDLIKSVRMLGLQGHVEFLGPAGLDEMPDIYAWGDIFVLPSHSEGLPKALLEAMAAGCAPVVSDVPGCRDLIQHGSNGLLVPEGDSASLSATLAHLIRNPESIEPLGRNARRVVETHFTWASVAEKVDACYMAVKAIPATYNRGTLRRTES